MRRRRRLWRSERLYSSAVDALFLGTYGHPALRCPSHTSCARAEIAVRDFAGGHPWPQVGEGVGGHPALRCPSRTLCARAEIAPRDFAGGHPWPQVGEGVGGYPALRYPSHTSRACAETALRGFAYRGLVGLGSKMANERRIRRVPWLREKRD